MTREIYAELGQWIGWTWLTASVLIASTLALAPHIGHYTIPGRDTALIFTGVGMLFSAVVPALFTPQPQLIGWSALASAIFVYLGTGAVLSEQNPFLLIVTALAPMYATLLVSIVVIYAILFRRWFDNLPR